MVWNVENFGNNVPAKGNYQPLCEFIAYVVGQERADILVIQEVRSGGTALLARLYQTLELDTGGNWFYDHVFGALVGDPRIMPPTSPAHTRNSMDHYEGYALFWNDGRRNDFTLVSPEENISQGTSPARYRTAAIPSNALTLVYRGRDTSGGIGQTGWFNAPNFDPGAPNAHYFLDFCRSAWRVHRGDQSPADSRRPCSFTINLDPGKLQKASAGFFLVPVTVFHNVSNSANASLSLELSGYSRQLYQVYNPDSTDKDKWLIAGNGIIAGDFNVDTLVAKTDRDAYYTYNNPYNANEGGANALPALFPWPNFNASPPTIVQLRDHFTGPLIVGKLPADFLRHSIDHIFYRMPNGHPARNCDGWVVDLFDMVMRSQNYPGLSDIIQKFMTPINTALGPLVGSTYQNYPYRQKGSYTPASLPDGNGPIIDNLLNWANLRTGITAGRFYGVNGLDNTDDARAAAEFIRQLISDHLPTVFTFDF
jgi:hypothetical protein